MTSESHMPEWKKVIGERLAPLKLAPTREAEIVEELAQHLEDRYAELLSGGAARGAACRARTDHARNQSEEKYDHGPVARPALRRANVVEKSRLHDDCRHHAGAGHRREHGDFQRGQRSVDSRVPVPSA